MRFLTSLLATAAVAMILPGSASAITVISPIFCPADGSTTDARCGSSAANPFIPSLAGQAFLFSLQTPVPGRWVFVDPPVATGYDYAIGTPGVSFHSVQIATSAGDGLYDLFDTTGGGNSLLQANLGINTAYDFAPGVTSFRISGIETSANLDPANTSAFVTALMFDHAVGTAPQNINFTQTPIVTDTSVPEPAALSLALLGLAGLGVSRRRN